MSQFANGILDIWSLAPFECIASFEAHPGSACTLEHYHRHIERDASIQRSCQEICLPEAEDLLC